MVLVLLVSFSYKCTCFFCVLFLLLLNIHIFDKIPRVPIHQLKHEGNKGGFSLVSFLNVKRPNTDLFKAIIYSLS